MKHIRNRGAEHRPFVCRSRPLGALMLAAMVGFSTLIPALADPPKLGVEFARKYDAFSINAVSKANLTLMLHAPSFQTLIEAQANRLTDCLLQGPIGGIHQGTKAVAVGATAGQPVRFTYRPGGRISLWIGDQSIDTGLMAAQARPMASFVDEGNNGLVALNDSFTYNFKRGYRPKVAGSYIDTEDGYWLLWADAIAEDLFYRAAFDRGDLPHGLTIVDSERPVTISTDRSLDIRGVEPRVAFWKRVEGKQGAILRYDDLGLMQPRCPGDVRAIETVRRVFKWAPVMRLAAESDPAAFKTFVRELEQVRIATVSTPRLLIEE